MSITYIIGTGNLSKNLDKKITKSKIISAKNFIKKINLINKKNQKFNLIFNSFYSSRKLNVIKSYQSYLDKTNYEVARVLDKLNSSLINKIIYTSSSSVYGLIKSNKSLNISSEREIYAAFKLSSEYLLRDYCNKKKIPLNICRVFNLYGGDDTFSIISKIKNIKKNKNILEINNNGLSVRDFIHISDVVKIYIKILNNVSDSNIFNIGTGKGVNLLQIINKTNINKNYFFFKKTNTNEIKISIADTRTLFNKIAKINFKKIEDYLKIKKDLKYNSYSN